VVGLAAVLAGGLLGGRAALAAPPAGMPCNLPVTGPVTARPWAQQRLDFERAWPLSRGTGVVVAVVDTGVQANHPLLKGSVLAGTDVVNGGTANTDCVGHGTLIAGLVAAHPRAGTGFAGVAPGATILPVRVSNSEQGSAGPLADGIRRAVNSGAKVINVSIVVGQSTPALRSAVAYAVAHNVVVVAAAGNESQAGSPVLYPAAYPGVLSVGAIGPDGTRATFSETGTGVGVVAPGQDIIGPGAGGPGLVAGGQGTSYAAAFVSGVAALVRQYRPELSAAQVISRIERTADHPPASTLPDPSLGWGTVNPFAALTAVLPGEPESTTAPPAGQRVRADARPVPDDVAGARAVRTALVALVATAGVAGLMVTLPAARRRRWRPGRRTV
jgi:type VII secretion-associated serine protease mycosin